jgi:hypothetical protein
VERPPHLSLLLPVPLFVIPQRSGGICGCPWGCSYFCLGPPAQSSHSEGRHPERSEGSLCFVLAVASAFTQAPPKSVISTEATHSSIVSSAVERPPHLSLLLPVPLSVIPQRRRNLRLSLGLLVLLPRTPSESREEGICLRLRRSRCRFSFVRHPPTDFHRNIFQKWHFLRPRSRATQPPYSHHKNTTTPPQKTIQKTPAVPQPPSKHPQT